APQPLAHEDAVVRTLGRGVPRRHDDQRGPPGPCHGAQTLRPMTTRVTPAHAAGSVTSRPSTSARTPGRDAGARDRYSAWSACTTAASTSSPRWYGVRPRAVSSSSPYIGSCTTGSAPASRSAVTVGKTPENAVSLTPPR